MIMKKIENENNISLITHIKSVFNKKRKALKFLNKVNRINKILDLGFDYNGRRFFLILIFKLQ